MEIDQLNQAGWPQIRMRVLFGCIINAAIWWYVGILADARRRRRCVNLNRFGCAAAYPRVIRLGDG